MGPEAKEGAEGFVDAFLASEGLPTDEEVPRSLRKDITHPEVTSVVEGHSPSSGGTYTREELAEMRLQKANGDEERPGIMETAVVEKKAEEPVVDEEEPAEAIEFASAVTVTRGREADIVKANRCVQINLVPESFPVVTFESLDGRPWTGNDVVQAITALRRGYRMYQSVLYKNRSESDQKGNQQKGEGQ